MYNGKEIRKVLKKAAVEPKKPDPFGKDVSMYGYRDDSPFRDSPSLNIFTKDGTIDMSNTGIPILANNRFLPPYSGMHQFDTKMVHEVPLAQKGYSVEKKVNKLLGNPMSKAQAAAVGESWYNPHTKTWVQEDAVDNFRHPMAGRYTAEAISNKFPSWMKYTGLPQTAGFVGANALGVAHEVLNPNRDPDYSWWDTVKEAGEDIYNNAVGATVGSLPFSSDKKTQILRQLSSENKLPDGYGKGNMYFKKTLLKQGGWLDNYAGGGDKGRTPIYTNDPNDPRLKAYTDSTDSYNFGVKSIGRFNNAIKKGKERGTPLKYMSRNTNTPWMDTNILPIESAAASPTGTPYGSPDSDTSLWESFARFKKPVQEVIYKEKDQLADITDHRNPPVIKSKVYPKKAIKKNESTIVHTDKAAYDEAYRAERDSLDKYNLGEKRFIAQKNVLTDGQTNGEKIIKIADSELKNYYNKIGTAKGMSNLPISMYSVTGYGGDDYYDYWNAPKNLWDKHTLHNNAPKNLLNVFRYKKPVMHNVYEEPVIESVKEQPKKVEDKKDYDNHHVNFNSPYGPVMEYYMGSKLVKTEPYTLQKKEEGGWLDTYQKGGQYSVVNYLADKGVDYSKESRAQIAKSLGIANYDYSAKKNLELLDKLKASERDLDMVKQPVPQAKPQVNFFKPDMKKMSSETTNRAAINPTKIKPISQEDVEISKLLPEQQKAIRLSKLSQSQKKPADMVRATEEQGVMSKGWDIATHPFTAATNLVKHGRIPDYFTQGEQNYMDIAGDVLNPFFYANAIGKTAGNLTDAKTYTDIPKAIGAGLINLAGDQAPDDWNEAGLSTLGKVGDAAAGLQGLKFAKEIPIAYRNNKYNNTLTLGKGADKKVFNNSIEWMKSYQDEIAAAGKARPLLKKEVNFLNKEIKQRGILETQRRHPLDVRSMASKALIVPENYNFSSVLNPKNLATNLYKTITEGSPESLYTMGHGRVAGWNQYLGIPTKNNPYRVHPESFTEGRGFTYTVPEEQLSKLVSKNQMPGSNATDDLLHSKSIEGMLPRLELRKQAFSGKTLTKEVNDKLYDDIHEIYENMGMPKKEIKLELGSKSKFKYSSEKDPLLANQWARNEGKGFRIGDEDMYIGSHGNFSWKAQDLPKGYQKWTMEDAWDINPLSRRQNLPQSIRNLNARHILGGKDYTANLDYFYNPKKGSVMPLVAQAFGGDIPIAGDGYVAGSWLPSQLRQGPDPGPPKLVDKRKLPKSGVVVDKRTNQAYYAGDKGQTGTFPVLTGQNPNMNTNPHSLDYLSKHPEARGTPLGYYIMNRAGASMPKFVAKEYENRVRNIDGIPAFGFPAPTAADLAAHWTFGKHEDPKEYARREKLYQCPPGKRWTSYGCVNMQASSFDAMNEAIPDPDTLMVLDSKYAADQALLKEMQSRMKEDGGESWVYNDDFYRMGGFNRTRLKREKRPKTSKNIATSINFLQQRNEMIFGPSGRHLYDPNTKGWLDKYK